MDSHNAAALRRHIMGVAGVVLLLVGVCLWIWPPESASGTFWHGSSVKSGLVLLAAWLAFPQLQRVPPWLFNVGIGLALLIAVRPRIAIVLTRVAWVFVPILGAIWILRRLGAKTPTQRHKQSPKSCGTP